MRAPCRPQSRDARGACARPLCPSPLPSAASQFTTSGLRLRNSRTPCSNVSASSRTRRGCGLAGAARLGAHPDRRAHLDRLCAAWRARRAQAPCVPRTPYLCLHALPPHVYDTLLAAGGSSEGTHSGPLTPACPRTDLRLRNTLSAFGRGARRGRRARDRTSSWWSSRGVMRAAACSPAATERSGADGLPLLPSAPLHCIAAQSPQGCGKSGWR